VLVGVDEVIQQSAFAVVHESESGPSRRFAARAGGQQSEVDRTNTEGLQTDAHDPKLT
jgi:hypothetical protein